MLKDNKIGKQGHECDKHNDANRQQRRVKTADGQGRYHGGAGHDQGVTANRDEIAMREVDQPEDAEQSDRSGRVIAIWD